jgi:hypothetical protein
MNGLPGCTLEFHHEGSEDMKAPKIRHLIEAMVLLALMTNPVSAQLEPSCMKDSPERRGELGCSLVEDKPPPETLKEPLFWHIDRFDSGEQARAAVGPASVALAAHGT